MSHQMLFSRRTFMLMPLALAACKPGPAIFEITGTTMGTTFNVVTADTPAGVDKAEIQTSVETALAQVNAQMSNWQSDSEISRFNAQTASAPVNISRELADVMQAAETIHMASDGTFDTTMGPLIELWGFGAQGTRAMPNADQIAAAQARSGHGNTLRVGADSLQKQQDDAQVYLAAIGKGYGADHVGRALEGLGIKNYLVEIGGDIYTSGHNPDGLPWQIGIETPEALDRGVLDVVGISNVGMASSGDYRNYYEQDGTRFSHIIDPTTGRPITHKTAATTVLANTAMEADAWATAMLILGRDRGLEVAEAQNLAVLFVERDPDAAQLSFKTASSRLFKEMTA